MIIDLFYGLGNQMFIYAFGEYIKYQKGFDIKFNTKGFKKTNTPDTKRDIEITRFPNVVLNEDNSIFAPNYHYAGDVVNKLKKIIYDRFHKIKKSQKLFEFDKEFVDSLVESDFVFGFFQSELYLKPIEDVIRKDFIFDDKLPPNVERTIDEIKNSRNSVSLHIRRGDYLNSSKFYSLSLNYYKKAISILKQNLDEQTLHFFVFSDDPTWVKNNFGDIGNYACTFVEGNDGYNDMRLMSLCKHNIIANSSFSWWGAWLNGNPNKIVVSPSYQTWFSADSVFKLSESPSTPNNWIIID